MPFFFLRIQRKSIFAYKQCRFMAKILLAEDEVNIASFIERGLKEFRHSVTVCHDGNTGWRILQEEPFDLVILDIIMPLLNGLDTARELRSEGITVPLIFLTSSRDFALESYEVKALNYLLKPIDSRKLFSVLDDFLKNFESSAETFTAHTANGFCKIALNDVDYLEAQNKWVLVYLSDGKVQKLREQFSKCEGIFTPEKGFFKCHRSYIVNLSRIRQFTRTQITTAFSSSVPISRNSYAAFKDAYFAFMFDSGTNFTTLD